MMYLPRVLFVLSALPITFTMRQILCAFATCPTKRPNFCGCHDEGGLPASPPPPSASSDALSLPPEALSQPSQQQRQRQQQQLRLDSAYSHPHPVAGLFQQALWAEWCITYHPERCGQTLYRILRDVPLPFAAESAGPSSTLLPSPAPSASSFASAIMGGTVTVRIGARTIRCSFPPAHALPLVDVCRPVSCWHSEAVSMPGRFLGSLQPARSRECCRVVCCAAARTTVHLCFTRLRRLRRGGLCVWACPLRVA